MWYAFIKSHFLGLECKSCGKFHVKLNTNLGLIVHKYLEGKMQRTLKKELTEFKIVECVIKHTANSKRLLQWDNCACSALLHSSTHWPMLWFWLMCHLIVHIELITFTLQKLIEYMFLCVVYSQSAQLCCFKIYVEHCTMLISISTYNNGVTA